MPDEIRHIEAELKDYEKRLLDAQLTYEVLALDAGSKRAQYDVRWADEFLKASTDGSKRTVPATEALITKIVAEDLIACRIAEALADGSKRRLETLKTVISSVQTRSGLLKTERSLLGYQPG